MKYLPLFPNAVKSIESVFTHNEYKHGKGIKFKSWQYEASKAIGHFVSAMYKEYNVDDNNYHIEAAASRALKALEAWHQEREVNENYHQNYER